jgi:hypothetical protein
VTSSLRQSSSSTAPSATSSSFASRAATSTTTSDAEVVTAIGVDQGAGIRFKPGGGEITLEVYREQGTPELDYRKLKARRRASRSRSRTSAAQREQYRGGRRQGHRKDDDEGNHMDTVKLIFTSENAAEPV